MKQDVTSSSPQPANSNILFVFSVSNFVNFVVKSLQGITTEDTKYFTKGTKDLL